MPINLAREKANLGKIIYQWKIKEYNQHDRDRRWVIIVGFISILLLIYGFWTTNYLFVLVIVLFGLILYLQHYNQPEELNFAMTETGVVVDNNYYKYSEFDSFWIIYNPPEVKNLYFSRTGVWKHRIMIPLLDNDPRPIKDYLGQYLDEDFNQEEEPLSDRMSRIFKI